MKKTRSVLWLILFVTLFSAFIDLPKDFHFKLDFAGLRVDRRFSFENLDFKAGPINFRRPIEVKKGLDLQGGTHLVFSADMAGIKEEDRESALVSAQENIEKRVNYFGVSEAVVQTAKTNNDYRLIVELPGVKDVDQAIELIGQTAQLQFLEENPDQEAASKSGEFFLQTDLTGKDLKRSVVQFDQNTGSPVVGLEFNPEGAKKFGEITTKNTGKIVAIFLDGAPVSLPVVEEPITTGNAVIRGGFSLEEAKKLA
ncbi:hypothetical protein C4578_01800, partial [Candidatus Microgenomates bacterium]